MSGLLPAPGRPRSPWQLLYGALLARRARRLAGSAERLPVPVISIGNLCWGGSGKTPFVLALAERLTDSGRRVAVLSRGYGRASEGPLVVCRGAGPEVELAAAGDEPYEIARALPDVAVVVAERRAEAGRLALAEIEPAPELFLLDDGFSHLALARDLDLLLFPAADPWARGRLLPFGFLREPLAAAARADTAILTGAAPDDPGVGAALAGQLARHGFGGEGFASATVVGEPRLVSGETVAPGAAVYAVAAIARPESFFASAAASGFRVVGREGFRDHSDYSDADLQSIERAAKRSGAELVLTTSKDRAKLEGRLQFPFAMLPIEARPEPRFWSWLDRRLAEISAGAERAR